MGKIDIEIDISNFLREPNLHDAEIINIHFDFKQKSSLTLLFKTEKGLMYELVFKEVIALSCQSVSVQNIVRDVLVLEQDLDPFLDSYKNFLNCEAEDINNCSLIHFIPSVGAELIIIFKGIEVFKK